MYTKRASIRLVTSVRQTVAVREWQPKTAHFWQLKSAYFGEVIAGGSGLLPLICAACSLVCRREAAARAAPTDRPPRGRLGAARFACAPRRVEPSCKEECTLSDPGGSGVRLIGPRCLRAGSLTTRAGVAQGPTDQSGELAPRAFVFRCMRLSELDLWFGAPEGLDLGIGRIPVLGASRFQEEARVVGTRAERCAVERSPGATWKLRGRLSQARACTGNEEPKWAMGKRCRGKGRWRASGRHRHPGEISQRLTKNAPFSAPPAAPPTRHQDHRRRTRMSPRATRSRAGTITLLDHPRRAGPTGRHVFSALRSRPGS